MDWVRRSIKLRERSRGTQRYQPTQRNDEDRLTQAIIALASQYGASDTGASPHCCNKRAGVWARIVCSASGGGKV